VDKDARLVVFPEFYTEGPPVRENRSTIGKQAERTARYLDIYKEYALKYATHLVPGTMVTKEDQSVFNTTFLIDPNGEILSRYSKINISPLESCLFTGGNEISVTRTDIGNIGLAVCFDLFGPEHIRSLVAKNAELIVCPSFWPDGCSPQGLCHDTRYSKKCLDAMTVTRAFENGTYFLFCNAPGTFKFRGNTYDLLGNSQITAPFIGQVGKLPAKRNGLLVREVDTKTITDAKKVYRIDETIERFRNFKQ